MRSRGTGCSAHHERSLLQRLHHRQQVARDLHRNDTNNLRRRLFEHKNGLVKGFTQSYRCHRLVYYESFDDVAKAIDREKQLKRWNRVKKVWLIKRRNPTWEDLAAEWFARHMYQPAKQVPPRAS